MARPSQHAVSSLCAWFRQICYEDVSGHDAGRSEKVVVFLTGSSMEALEALLGAREAGAVVCPINTRWSVEEMSRSVKLVNPVCIVTDEMCFQKCEALLDSLKEVEPQVLMSNGQTPEILAPSSHSLKDIVSDHSDADGHVFSSVCKDEDPAFLVFTSGTTSQSKGVLISNKSMRFQCKAKMIYCGYNKEDIYLHTAPWYHVGGLCSALAMVDAGAKHYFLPLFDAALAIEIIERQRISAFIAVPTMMAELMAAARQKSCSASSFDSVRTVLLGAGAVSDKMTAALHHYMRWANVYTAYGMTEACSSLTFSRLGASAPMQKNSDSMFYVGQPPRDIEIAVLPRNGVSGEVAIAGSGELVTRGPHLFLRYWNARDDVSSYFYDLKGSKWFKTGDLGRVSGGHVWLLGRVKDIVKTGGENVVAAEVERCLLDHPGIDSAAVVGIPDEKWGEMVAAALVCTAAFLATYPSNRHAGIFQKGDTIFDDISNYCKRKGLSSFKIPKLIIVLPKLPQNATGKVIKPMLKEVIVGGLQLQQASKL